MAAVHVVSKLDNSEHAVCKITSDNSVLAPSSVRAQSLLISLTSNNLTYARNGGRLHWWDVYPVPPDAPAPFNNHQEWGIVPAWGYARVVESTVDAIAKGSLLYGMWPTSVHFVDLQLRRSEPAGHWIECSPHRDQLMTAYNHYEEASPTDPLELQMTALCKPLSGGPSLLNSSVFSAQRLHPFGTGAPWSEEDADLSSAVVISLSASSKTGRSFFWELARNRDTASSGPLALLQLTSAPETLPQSETNLPVKSMSYSDLDSVSWAQHFQPSRIVILDFGAPDAVLESVRSSSSKIAASVTVISIGYEAKVYKPEELQARMATNGSKVQLNTSGLRDQAVKLVGADKYFQRLDTDWKRWLEEKAYGNLQVKVMSGVEGRQGIEGAWSDLCQRRVPANVGMIVDLSK